MTSPSAKFIIVSLMAAVLVAWLVRFTLYLLDYSNAYMLS